MTGSVSLCDAQEISTCMFTFYRLWLWVTQGRLNRILTFPYQDRKAFCRCWLLSTPEEWRLRAWTFSWLAWNHSSFVLLQWPTCGSLCSRIAKLEIMAASQVRLRIDLCASSAIHQVHKTFLEFFLVQTFSGSSVLMGTHIALASSILTPNTESFRKPGNISQKQGHI